VLEFSYDNCLIVVSIFTVGLDGIDTDPGVESAHTGFHLASSLAGLASKQSPKEFCASFS